MHAEKYLSNVLFDVLFLVQSEVLQAVLAC